MEGFKKKIQRKRKKKAQKKIQKKIHREIKRIKECNYTRGVNAMIKEIKEYYCDDNNRYTSETLLNRVIILEQRESYTNLIKDIVTSFVVSSSLGLLSVIPIVEHLSKSKKNVVEISIIIFLYIVIIGIICIAILLNVKYFEGKYIEDDKGLNKYLIKKESQIIIDKIEGRAKQNRRKARRHRLNKNIRRKRNTLRTK